MSELLIGIVGMVLLYWLGTILYPDENTHTPIQQELIKMGDEKNEP